MFVSWLIIIHPREKPINPLQQGWYTTKKDNYTFLSFPHCLPVNVVFQKTRGEQFSKNSILDLNLLVSQSVSQSACQLIRDKFIDMTNLLCLLEIEFVSHTAKIIYQQNHLFKSFSTALFFVHITIWSSYQTANSQTLENGERTCCKCTSAFKEGSQYVMMDGWRESMTGSGIWWKAF